MTGRQNDEPLRHHGDVDAAPGLLDFAVNVRLERPPRWLRAKLASGLDRLGHYPLADDDRHAREVVAARHGRSADEVLPLSGASECFALLPWLRPRQAVVVHPSFTEPDLALRTAGIPVTRVVLDASDGYQLRSADIPEEADLVVLGNPTNPTSILHPAEIVRRLVRRGRIIVVDEAFADAVPGESESLASDPIPGVLVVRSLTKMWGLAGLRAGYVLGDAESLFRLDTHRPHWPVGSLTYAAISACCTPEAVAESARAANVIRDHRDAFAAEISTVEGVHVVRPAAAPFLLLRVMAGASVRASLRERGFAVRRGDTFPGLTEDHMRVAVRSSTDNAAFTVALHEIMASTPGARTDSSMSTG